MQFTLHKWREEQAVAARERGLQEMAEIQNERKQLAELLATNGAAAIKEVERRAGAAARQKHFRLLDPVIGPTADIDIEG